MDPPRSNESRRPFTPTNIHYAGWAQPDSVWGSGQPRQRMWLGTNGRVDSLEAGAAGSATRMRYKYDMRGRVTSVRDPLQHQTDSMVYTGTNGNTWKVIRPGNRTTTYGYDIYGRVDSIAAPGLATRTIEYDLVNRVKAVYDGVNPNPTRYWYDVSFDSFTKDTVVDPKGQVYKFAYDRIGRPLNIQHPSGDVVASYQYGWDSQVKRVTNARGQNIDFTYDALHRLVKSFGDSIQTDSLHYSADHRVITAFGPVTTDWTYLNVRGVPDSVKTRRGGWDYWLRYAYTAAGLLDSVAPSGVCCPPFLSRNYGYNTLRGTLDSIRLSGALTRFTLNSDLQPGTVTFPGGDQVSRGFTALHNEMLITTSAAYSTTTERKITLDTPGRLWRQLRDNLSLNQGVGHLYNYDGLGRLVTDTLAGKLETTPSCTGQDPLSGMECSYDGDFWSYWWVMDRDTFAYDAVGNRADNGGGYSTGNRITVFAGCGYGTDPDGNVTFRDCTGQRVDIRWDAANRPTRFTVNGVAYDLYYDASGRVVQKDSAGVVQRYFLWDGENLFAELRGVDGEKVAEYSYYPGLDNLHAVIIGSTPYYAHTDGVGNVVALTGADQSVYADYSYDAWGANGAYFKGAQRMVPEVELYYMRNRWYEPKTGRFLSEDPIGLEGGINPYVFAANDPVNARDPTGNQCTPEWLIVTEWFSYGDGTEGPVTSAYSIWVCQDLSGAWDGGWDAVWEAMRSSARGSADGSSSRQSFLDRLLKGPKCVYEGQVVPGYTTGNGACQPLTVGVVPFAPIGPKFVGNAISGFTKHGLNQVINRGVRPTALLDAARRGSVLGPMIDALGRESLRFVGSKAEFVINLMGRVVTAWRR